MEHRIISRKKKTAEQSERIRLKLIENVIYSIYAYATIRISGMRKIFDLRNTEGNKRYFVFDRNGILIFCRWTNKQGLTLHCSFVE